MVNPSNGRDWFQILWKLPFEEPRYKINLEKLYALSSAACSSNLKCSMLRLLGQDENVKQSYGMPLGDHQYILWLAKEVWMDQLLEDASRLVIQVVISNIGKEKLVLPQEPSLDTYFLDIVGRYRAVLFVSIEKEMNVATPAAKHVDLKNASRRLVYKYIILNSVIH